MSPATGNSVPVQIIFSVPTTHQYTETTTYRIRFVKLELGKSEDHKNNQPCAKFNFIETFQRQKSVSSLVAIGSYSRYTTFYNCPQFLGPLHICLAIQLCFPPVWYRIAEGNVCHTFLWKQFWHPLHKCNPDVSLRWTEKCCIKRFSVWLQMLDQKK